MNKVENYDEKEIICKNENLILINNNDKIIVNLNGNIKDIDNILIKNLNKFIECKRLYVVDKNVDIVLLNKLSLIFNFKLYLL